MSSEPQLNPAQREAVEHLGTPLLVLAGAGSGKTGVITNKIVHLIRRCGIAAHNIAAITFTNKAAREMRQRTHRLLGNHQASGLTVCTFHSLGLMLLRNEYRHLNYRPGFSIFDTQDSEMLLREITDKKLDKGEIAQARQRISDWKSTLISPLQALRDAEDDDSYTNAQIYQDYQRRLAAYNAMDFDDLIAQPVRLLTAHEQVCRQWQNRLRHLLIDEYQDTNACQYTLMKLLIGANSGITAVGDDDQSIYAWRGARPENLALLAKDFSNLTVIKLEQNYRSTNRILQCANVLIANNSHQFSKQLWSAQGLGSQLRILPSPSPDQEARRIAADILGLRFRDGDKYRNYAVLYRGNHQSRPLERALREHRIPYKVSGGTSFFETTEVKDLVAYLRLLNNSEDDPAFLRIVNTPKRGIGTSTLEKLARHAVHRRLCLSTAAGEIALQERLSANSRPRLQRLADWLQEMTHHALHMDPANLLQRVIEDTYYYDWLKDTGKNRQAAQKRIDNVNEFLEWVQRLVNTEEEAPLDLEQMLNQMSLMDIIERNNAEKSLDAVHLMTLHAAKGLEFSNVWIAGMEEGLLPHHSHVDGKGLEEERRLAYVGITRAKQRLTFSYSTRRSRHGESIECEPSRFLFELPEQHVLWEQANPDSGGARARQTGKAHLSSLKALLKGST